MIRVIRADGVEILLNTLHIDRVEGSKDTPTIITLDNGEKIEVKTPAYDVVHKIKSFRFGISQERREAGKDVNKDKPKEKEKEAEKENTRDKEKTSKDRDRDKDRDRGSKDKGRSSSRQGSQRSGYSKSGSSRQSSQRSGQSRGGSPRPRRKD